MWTSGNLLGELRNSGLILFSLTCRRRPALSQMADKITTESLFNWFAPQTYPTPIGRFSYFVAIPGNDGKVDFSICANTLYF